MKRSTRPTGIIRTLPSLSGNASVGAKRYELSIAMLERDQIPAIYIALAQMPKIEVLHIYLLMDGEIKVRLNIAGYEPGSKRECWDNTIRKPKFWAVCSAPVSRPTVPICKKGFQGFRYTVDLW